MAKRIIERGSTTFRCTCEECGTLFQYDKSDVIKRNFTDDWVTCPECGHLCRHFGHGLEGGWGGCRRNDDKKSWAIKLPNAYGEEWFTDGTFC